ncbi:glycosyltransferase [uncultured Psychrobacter sp.]|uniref:glycosyltransferase family 2 protein n=1 Tax=uncultured Psychrobacter sp. TaxID=259303 RepID=UPI00260711C4|nr:glycosyltransferase [uncultured Psychrobacter sp.]
MKRNKQNSGLPLVSVIIPCYNSESYISECIDSILNQDYQNIEIIVVDDGSTDNSINILKKIKDIDIYSQENSGACVARNKGLKNSRGKYIKFLDSDDFLEPGVIKKQVDLAESLKNNVIVYGDYYISKENCKFYGDTFLSYSEQTASIILSDILTSTPLHQKWMLEKVEGFDERFKNGQEWNLHVRLSSEGFIFHHQKIPIFNYRIHNSIDRISIVKYNDKKTILHEALKIEMTEERLSDNSTGDVGAALSFKYWIIAKKLYRNGYSKEYKIYLKKSKALTKDFKKYWSLKYSILYRVLGFRLSDRLIRVYDLSRKSENKFI